MKDATREVEKAINTIKLPKDATKPIVSQLNTSMIPLLKLQSKSKTDFQKQMKTNRKGNRTTTRKH